jgi:hypothetical protein
MYPKKLTNMIITTYTTNGLMLCKGAPTPDVWGADNISDISNVPGLINNSELYGVLTQNGNAKTDMVQLRRSNRFKNTPQDCKW